MVPLALVLFARDTGSGYGRAGLLTAAYSLGCCLGGPALSRVMDLRGQRAALVARRGGVVAGARGAALVARRAARSPSPSSPGWRRRRSNRPCARSGRRCCSPRQVPSAFALDAAAQELIFVLGPLVVLLAQLGGASGGGLVAAAVVGLLGHRLVRGVPGLARLDAAGPRGPALGWVRCARAASSSSTRRRRCSSG